MDGEGFRIYPPIDFLEFESKFYLHFWSKIYAFYGALPHQYEADLNSQLYPLAMFEQYLAIALHITLEIQ